MEESLAIQGEVMKAKGVVMNGRKGNDLKVMSQWEVLK